MASSAPSRPFNPWRHGRPSRDYDPKYRLPGFETRELAEERRQGVVAVLPKPGLFSSDLMTRMGECEAGNRCASASCPVCLRRMRRLLAGSGMELLEVLGWRPGLGVSACLVPGIRFEVGQLHTFDMERENERLRARLARSALANHPLFGGWDFSLNEHSEGAWRPFWQPHLYLLMPTVEHAEGARGALKLMFPAGETAPRPVRLRVLTDPVKAITYSYKPFFQRRVSYLDQDGHLDNRDLPLRPEQERELRLFLDRVGFTGRLFLRNIRRRGDRLVPDPVALPCRRDRKRNPSKSA